MIERPKKITVCFIGGNVERTNIQQDSIINQNNDYEFFFWRRCDKFEGYYYTWSQIANECISESPNEYIIFINPKVDPLISDIDHMIDKLISGYCFVSVIGTGYCGTTVELFRNIGLFDERYFGSEYEDDDFSMRLKMFNKAIIWGYDFSRYPEKESPLSPNRGCALSFFEKKWNMISENEYLLDMNLYSTQKKLHGHILNSKNNLISESWMDYTESEFSDHHVGLRGRFAKISEDTRNDETVRTSGKIRLWADSGKCNASFECDIQTRVYIVFVNAENDREFNLSSRITLNPGTWHSDYIDANNGLEIKVFHEGEKIYHDRFVTVPFDKEINIGLRITQKV